MQLSKLKFFALPVLLWVAACADSTPAERGTTASESSEQIDLRADQRIAKLLSECPDRSIYAHDVGQSSVLIERLVDKLSHGQLEALKRAREELALIGAPAVPQLRRLIESSYSNAFEAPYIENALGVANLMQDAAGHELLLLGFNHPQESVRSMAVTGLRLFHAQAKDFDMLLERLGAPEPLSMRINLGEALFRADRSRAEALVLSWIEEGTEQELWSKLIPMLCASKSEAVHLACGREFDRFEEPLVKCYLAANAAAGGDQAARAWILEALKESSWNIRMLLVDALAKANWTEPMLDIVRHDESEQVRAIAADHLAQADGWNDERRDAIAALMDASDQMTRVQALQRLIERGDSEAIDRALDFLRSKNSEPMQAAILALRDPMANNGELRERVKQVLDERNQAESGAPLADRQRTIKALGLLSTAWAADTMIDIARAYPGERIESLRAHEWILIQASNTGSAGHRQIYVRLLEEQDPLRRLDMIRSISSTRTEEARELLLELAEGGAQSELELLYVADRLARVGPSYLVAPRLKRVLYDVQTLEIRRALSCLLWHWY